MTPARASGATTDVDVSRVTRKLPHGVPPVAFTYPVVSAASAASAATLKD